MCCIASTDISSLATRHTSPPDSPSSAFVTMRLFLPSYRWEISKAKTLTHSFLSYIQSMYFGPSFINLLNKVSLRIGISKEVTSPMKSGNPFFISQLVGDSLPSAG